MADADYPPRIDRARHEELTGRTRYVWLRRVAIVLVAVMPVLALVNVFGQHSALTVSVSPAASLGIDSPSRVRGGLIFTTKIVVTPSIQINDGQIYLDNGWFQNMSLNAVSPQPSNQSAQGPWQVWDFGQMPAHTAYTIWISWQTNPVNIGTRSQTIELYDGKDKLMTAHHTLTVFP